MPRNAENAELSKRKLRRCSICRRIRSVDDFHKRENTYQSACKFCKGIKNGVSPEQKARLEEKRKLFGRGRRRCYSCGRVRHVKHFTSDPSQSDGLKVHCKPCHAKYMKKRSAKWRHALRREALQRYGGKCACCGEARFEFLAIDHTRGGGNKHRKSGQFHPGLGFLTWLKKNEWPKGYRILCHNCNSALGYYGYCPHKRRTKARLLTRLPGTKRLLSDRIPI